MGGFLSWEKEKIGGGGGAQSWRGLQRSGDQRMQLRTEGATPTKERASANYYVCRNWEADSFIPPAQHTYELGASAHPVRPGASCTGAEPPVLRLILRQRLHTCCSFYGFYRSLYLGVRCFKGLNMAVPSYLRRSPELVALPGRGNMRPKNPHCAGRNG